jgi:predicted AAA+ superfamily ATPase
MRLKAVQVFTPNDIPTFTYIERDGPQLEKNLTEAIETPKQIISLSGPSKSGKTVLVKKVIKDEHLIAISGASI